MITNINHDSLNPIFNHYLYNINNKLNNFYVIKDSWIIQRGKANWLSNGEDDLHFLYRKIKIRGNIHKIRQIVTQNGTFTNHIDIANVAICYFKHLFNPTVNFSRDYNCIPFGDKFSFHLLSNLTVPITNENIKNIVFFSPKNSTQGPDGFNFEFFIHVWDTIDDHICEALNHFFPKKLPRNVKVIVITLIPKGAHVGNLNDYKPISLCNIFIKS